MSASSWLIVAIVGFSLAGIALIVAVVMFIRWDIPSVLGDLSGKTVARGVKAIQEADKLQNDNKKKAAMSGKMAQSDKSVMGYAHASKRLDGGNVTDELYDSNGTEVLSSNGTEVLSSNGTEVLSSNGTEVLSSNGTEVLSSNGTEVLSSNGTTVLSSNATTVLSQMTGDYDGVVPVTFKVVKTLMAIHTEEKIS